MKVSDLVALNRDHRRRWTETITRFGPAWQGQRDGTDAASYQTLLEHVPAEMRGPTLELGAGVGGAFELLSDMGYLCVVGIDILPEHAKAARAKKLPVRQGRMERLPFEDGAFGAVVSRHTLEHTPDPRKAIAEIWRVLRPGGYTAHVVPAFAGSATEPAHLTNFGWPEWAPIWGAAGFEVVLAEHHVYADRELHMVLRKP